MQGSDPLVTIQKLIALAKSTNFPAEAVAARAKAAALITKHSISPQQLVDALNPPKPAPAAPPRYRRPQVVVVVYGIYSSSGSYTTNGTNTNW